MKKYSFLVLLISMTVCSFAQTEMLNSQYLFEKTFVTPANFSQEETLRIFMNYQSTQGRERAGENSLYSLAANYRMKNQKSLIGVNLVNNKFGPEGTLMGYLNYTYNIQLSDDSYISNGFGLGFQQYRLDLSNSEGVIISDPSLSGNIYSSKFDFRIGATAVLKKTGYVGVSFDNVLSRYNNQNDVAQDYLPASFKRINMTIMAGNKTALDNEFDLTYEGIYTHNFGGIKTFDLNGGVLLVKKIGVGLSYRRAVKNEEERNLGNGLVRPYLTLALDKNNNNLKFNYAYGFASNKINTVGINTHEFGLTFLFK